MLYSRLFKSVVVGLSAILIATGVAFAPVGAAFAEEAPGSTAEPTATPSTPPTEQPVAPETPAPTETPSPTPTPTDVPTDAPTDVPTETPTPSPTPTPTDLPTETPAPSETQVPTENPVAPEAETPSEPGPPAEMMIEPFAMSSRAVSSDFQAGNIISDYNFYNGSAMTEAQIQSFLDAKIGTCQNSNCLNVYRMDTPTKTFGFGTCSTYQGAANESAARIIHKVQLACDISAKVILVTLQKEQGLVTNDQPPLSDLRKAMGYGCPDTSECDSNFYGFFNQVFTAGRQLTWYGNPDGSFTTIKVGQTNPVRYHPVASCGSASVTIQNRATAALYYYTPYQPNAAALAADNASSDPCASYGNRNFSRYYNSWFGDPTDGKLPSVSRISGADRFATAVAISKTSYPNSGVPVVYITTGESFPDALSAAPAAATQGGPLLLTFPTQLPSATSAELARLNPQRIVVVGGKQAVNDAVYTQLKKIQPNIERISGIDRYETARKIATSVFPGARSAYVATGLNFPDALSASAAAGAKGIPVLLVDDSRQVNPATLTALKSIGVTSVKIVGGPQAISATQESDFKGAGLGTKRLYGSDRIRTSIAINNDAFPGASTIYLATAVDYPDALAGAAAAGKAKSPLYVSFPTCMPAEVRDAITDRKASNLKLLGGANALNSTVAQLGRC